LAYDRKIIIKKIKLKLKTSERRESQLLIHGGFAESSGVFI